MTENMPSPATPTRWAYHFLEGPWDSNLLAQLNAAGADGWAVVSMAQAPRSTKVIVARAY